MKKWNWVIDVEKCENCTNCYLACKDEHVGNTWPGYSAPQPDHGHKWITVKAKERGQFPLVDVAYLPLACMHCDKAPCLEAADPGTIVKRPDGIVLINPNKAKGQKSLVSSCPYGAIYWNEGLDMPQKCTLCAHLLDTGWTKPRCVQSCPTGALELIAADDAEMKKTAQAEGLETYMPELHTSPRAYYRNLYRFNQCFVAGSVAILRRGQQECAQGARVFLAGPSGQRGDECLTDCYGDFKFDRLQEDSGTYHLQISLSGYKSTAIQLDVKKSVNIGVVYLAEDD